VTTGIIVVSVVALAAAFTVAWLVRPDLRDRIERPKHGFLASLERYDRQCRDNRTTEL